MAWSFLLLLLVVTGVMGVVPLVPAWREWRRPTDAHPLQVVRDLNTDPFHFAERFAERARPLLTRGDSAWAFEDAVRVVADGSPVHLETEHAQDEGATSLISSGPLRLAAKVRLSRELMTTADAEVGSGATLRALYADGKVQLGPGVKLARWLHAGAGINAGPGCVLRGRVTSHGRIRLAPGTQFARLHAPRITTGSGVNSTPATRRTQFHPEPLRGDVLLSPGVRKVQGHCALPPGTRLDDALVVRGNLIVGFGSHLHSIKASGSIELEAQVVVKKSTIAGGSLNIGPHCHLGGPVVSETHIHITSGSVIGTQRRPTSITAPAVTLDAGVECSGTLWARDGGLVGTAEV
ncbi:MAG: hypothetical protein SV583_10525 [Pseudomonadota bacterium]|nr:hypothetical protein [Pseudomonadota bacterium]